jgi:DNA mismatch repair protein MutL
MEVKLIGSPSMRQRIVSIFLAKPMRSWFRCKRRQIVTIHGFIGKPEFAKKNRGEQFFFVNDRFIKFASCDYGLTMAFTRRRTT